MNKLEQEARRIVDTLLLWDECDEFHIHTGPGKNADPDDGHKSFDDDQATAAIMELVRKGQAEVLALPPVLKDPTEQFIQQMILKYGYRPQCVECALHPSNSQKGGDHA